MTRGIRGRPLGYRMGEESKRAIAETKRGQFHRQETKDKISRSLIIYFKQFNSLTDEIIDRYCRTDDDEICRWAVEVKEELDNSEFVLTEKTMWNRRKTELSCGHNIEFFGHGLTPEFMVILKELFEEYGDDIDKILDEL